MVFVKKNSHIGSGPCEQLRYILPEFENASFIHPKNFYSEYTGEHSELRKSKALMRCWDFAQLGSYAMEQSQRANIGLRERRVIDYVAGEAPQIKKDYLMQPRHSALEGEVEEDFTEVYEHPPLLIRLDEYLEEVPFTKEARIGLLRCLLTPFVELHSLEIAHRDIALERLWYDKNSQAVIVSGLIAARFPMQDKLKSIGDMREVLSSNLIPIPEEKLGEEIFNSIGIDVYQLGAISYHIAFNERLKSDEMCLNWHAPKSDIYDGLLDGWIKKSISIDPNDRFRSASEMLNELSSLDSYSYDISNEEEKRVMNELAEFSKPEIIPFVEWIPCDKPVQDSFTGKMSYSSSHNDKKAVVKIWSQLIPVPKNTGLNRRILNFLEKCQKIQKINFKTSPIIDFGWCNMGLFLVSEYVDGVTLDEFIDSLDRTDKSLEQRFKIAEKLISLVKQLHDSELNHGDLKPDNILVNQSSGELFLIDCLDVDRFGEFLENTGYAPKKNVSGKYRDIYACYCIVDDVFGYCKGYSKKIREEIARALGDDLQKIPNSLSPLQDSLDAAKLIPVDEKNKVLNIYYHDSNCSEIAKKVMPYDGFVLLSVGKFNREESSFKVYIVGKKEKITLILKLENNSLRLLRKFYNEMSPADVIKDFRNHKTNKKVVLIDFDVVFVNEIRDNSELSEFLLDLSIVKEKLSITMYDREKYYHENSLINISDIWQSFLRAELDLHQKVTIGGNIEYHHKFFKIPINEDFQRYDYGVEDVIQVTDGDAEQPWILGILKVSECTSDTLVVEGRSPNKSKLKLNAQLALQEHRTVISWQRRKKALQRLLRNEALIPDLVSYFSTNRSDVDNVQNLPFPSKKLWKYYEKFLDKSKLKAFKRILSGSLNVIVGPPGTGKTTLLAYLLDYLNRIPEIERILLVSQSHVAVNEVASKVRQVINCSIKENGDIRSVTEPEMVRLGDRNKVSESLLDVHIDALQSQYRTSFHQDFENRFLCLARKLKVPDEFIFNIAIVYRNINFDMHQYMQIKNNTNLTVEDKKKIEKIKSRLSKKIGQYVDESEFILESNNPLRSLIDIIANDYGINNPKKMKKLEELLMIIHQWYQRLSADSDGFAGFMARTRKLVIGTLVGIGKSAYDIASHEYDIAIIDEAGRASAGELAMAMQSARRVILVGDHNQLPPHYEKETLAQVQKELQVSEDILNITDFERAYNVTDGIMLDTQYRMEKPIGDIVSNVFYEGCLNTDTEKSEYDLSILPSPWNCAVTWLDTTSRDAGERRLENSIVNKFEVELICSHLKRLSDNDYSIKILRSWAKDDSHHPIGIITGYSQQVRLLRERLENDSWATSIRNMIKIDTIDSYQGSENRFVILSLVRHNIRNNAGFMNDYPRINVAISRARNRLLIIGATSMWKDASKKAPMGKVFHFIDERCKGCDQNYQILSCEKYI